MKSIKIINNTAIITSDLTVKELKDAKKFAPNSLILFVERENGYRDAVFALGVDRSEFGKMDKMSLVFSEKAEGNAFVTLVYPVGTDVKTKLFEEHYSTITNLELIETQVVEALNKVDANRKHFESIILEEAK